ncbi:MAG: tyrosine-type recombinase/integrase [Chloroflexi bacterium]|nr:tyrosine-type recombinase/integrase [Chloroflexota bacterium]
MPPSPTRVHRVTIAEAIDEFLQLLRHSRSPNTARAYSVGMDRFVNMLETLGVESTDNTSILTAAHFSSFIDALHGYSAATERLYLAAVKRFYDFLDAEDLAQINSSKLQLILQSRVRKQGPRLPQFPREDIETLVQAAMKNLKSASEDLGQLRSLRDSAFLITLADTGLRVHEICNLRRGDFDWDEQKAVIIGKGNSQAVIRFSHRAAQGIKQYLQARAHLDGASGKPLGTLPIFARHDRGASNKVKPITTTTGRNIVKAAVVESLGKEALGRITPHSFRHYFVTSVLRGSGGNLKLAQELARHRNIQVTQRYAHLSQDELDRGYHEIFDEQEP